MWPLATLLMVVCRHQWIIINRFLGFNNAFVFLRLLEILFMIPSFIRPSVSTLVALCPWISYLSSPSWFWNSFIISNILNFCVAIDMMLLDGSWDGVNWSQREYRVGATYSWARKREMWPGIIDWDAGLLACLKPTWA